MYAGVKKSDPRVHLICLQTPLMQIDCTWGCLFFTPTCKETISM